MFTACWREGEMGGRETREGERAPWCEASPGGAEEGEGGGGEGSPGDAGCGCWGGYRKAQDIAPTGDERPDGETSTRGGIYKSHKLQRPLISQIYDDFPGPMFAPRATPRLLHFSYLCIMNLYLNIQCVYIYYIQCNIVSYNVWYWNPHWLYLFLLVSRISQKPLKKISFGAFLSCNLPDSFICINS